MRERDEFIEIYRTKVVSCAVFRGLVPVNLKLPNFSTRLWKLLPKRLIEIIEMSL